MHVCKCELGHPSITSAKDTIRFESAMSEYESMQTSGPDAFRNSHPLAYCLIVKQLKVPKVTTSLFYGKPETTGYCTICGKLVVGGSDRPPTVCRIIPEIF